MPLIPIPFLVLMNINQDDEKKKFSTYCMDVQNVIRQYFGAPPLVWDDVLAERAQALALYLSGSQVAINDCRTLKAKFMLRNIFRHVIWCVLLGLMLKLFLLI